MSALWTVEHRLRPWIRVSMVAVAGLSALAPAAGLLVLAWALHGF